MNRVEVYELGLSFRRFTTKDINQKWAIKTLTIKSNEKMAEENLRAVFWHSQTHNSLVNVFTSHTGPVLNRVTAWFAGPKPT